MGKLKRKREDHRGSRMSPATSSKTGPLAGPTHLRSSVCLWVHHAFSTSTLHITEPRIMRERERERERESVGAEKGMEDGSQREENKRMRARA